MREEMLVYSVALADPIKYIHLEAASLNTIRTVYQSVS